MFLAKKKFIDSLSISKTVRDTVLQDELRLLINEVIALYYLEQHKITLRSTSWTDSESTKDFIFNVRDLHPRDQIPKIAKENKLINVYVACASTELASIKKQVADWRQLLTNHINESLENCLSKLTPIFSLPEIENSPPFIDLLNQKLHLFYEKKIKPKHYDYSRQLYNASTKESIDLNKGLITEDAMLRESTEFPPQATLVDETARIEKINDGFMIRFENGRGYQEDFANISSIAVGPWWQDNMADLLVLTMQKIAWEIAKHFPEQQKVTGSTATLLFPGKDNKVYVAWVGDSPAYLFIHNTLTNKVEVTLLTWSHQINKWDQTTECGNFETARVKKAGGRVNDEEGRVFHFDFAEGGLVPTRGFGDTEWPGLTDIPSVSVTEVPKGPGLKVFF